MNSASFTKHLYTLLIILTISSCNNETNKIRLVYPKKVNYESFIIADHLCYFDKSKIETITVSSGINSAESIILNNGDIAAMGDGPSSIVLAKNPNTRIVCRYAKGNFIHRLISQSDIRSIPDLKGKKIGIQIGSSTNAALLAWLKKQGFKESNYQLIPMNPQNMPEAMKSKQLDAIAGSEPWALNTEILCQSTVHELANLNNSTNHFPHLLISKKSTIDKNTEKIKEIIEALSKANKFISQHPDSAAKIAAHYIGLDPKDEKICMSRLKWEIGWEYSDEKSLEESINFFLRSNKIKTKPSVDERVILW